MAVRVATTAAMNEKVARKKPAARQVKNRRGKRGRRGLDRTLVLVGLMGTGKTTVGRRLARRLGVRFIDSDEEIEKAARLKVADIFDIYGEPEFRSLERRVIERLLTGKPCVLATGGGAFMDDETRGLIREKGQSVWLHADVDVLVERTGKRDTRPLLKTGDPKEILSALSKKRNPVYAEADLKVESARGPHDKVVDQIMKKLREHGEKS